MPLWVLPLALLFAQYRDGCPDLHSPPAQPAAGLLVLPLHAFPLEVRQTPDPQAPARSLRHCQQFVWHEITEEEPPALAVLDRRGSWYRIQLAAGSGWVQARFRHKFTPIEELIRDGSYLRAGWQARLSATPGVPPAIRLPQTFPDSHAYIQILDRQRHNGLTWLHVQVYSQDDPYEPETRRNHAQGWVPIVATWFFSRD
jgi:hypothetical protein